MFIQFCKQTEKEMGSRIEHVIKCAIQSFATRPNGNNIRENIKMLKGLVSEITANDIGMQPSDFKTFSVSRHSSTGSKSAPVTYIPIFENSEVSVGVFILKEEARIPLHDHQGMYGILKVLYGNLRIQSYTSITNNMNQMQPDFTLQQGLAVKKLPLVCLTEKDPAASLFPIEQNFHELWSAGGPAAFLDILAPPYNDARDCYYYIEKPNQVPDSAECSLARIPCPSAFWCDSTEYRGPNLQHLYK